MEGVPQLRGARRILLVDWPSRDVPDTLAKGGWTVVAQEGPDRYVAYDADGDEVRPRDLEAPPGQADLVYMFRPLDELEGILDVARSLGARHIWLETTPPTDELAAARTKVEAAGLTLATGSIADAARSSQS